jgi:hypothetical protein
MKLDQLVINTENGNIGNVIGFDESDIPYEVYWRNGHKSWHRLEEIYQVPKTL